MDASFSRRKKRSSGLNVGKFPNNQIGKNDGAVGTPRSRIKAVRRNWRRVASVPETRSIRGVGTGQPDGVGRFS